MPKTVVAVHTASSVIKIVADAFKEQLPDVAVINILDDSIVPAAVAAGRITDDLARRMYYHFAAADATGADLVLLTCSTVGETADIARPLLRAPILKIDEPMAELAVQQAHRIGVLATVQSTLGPTARLLQTKAQAAGRVVETKTQLAEGAFQALSRGETEKHDELVLAVIDALAKEVDAIVFAQASMVRLLPKVTHVSVPIFSSPSLAAARVAEILKAQ